MAQTQKCVFSFLFDVCSIRVMQGALIPAGVDISRLEISETVSWVLIVEKEVRE